ncbi:TonB family protein [Altererythrobacter fulvus]|uniref:energy transducer TonB n=1 Tax=Caenibius fulvus TaxID=2126012 RepID=UPI00301B422B
MAYVDRQSGASKATSIATVAIVHAALGAVLIYGLATEFVKAPTDTHLKVNKFPLPKTPPPTETPSATPSSTITTVNPPLDTKQNDEVKVEPRPFPTSSEVFADPTPHPTIAPTVPVTPTPPPLFTPKNPSPANDRSGWVTTADYPTRDLRLGHTGTAKYRVVISSSGKVQSCEITGTSGFAGLDEATCKYVSRRARFDPASNSNGEKVVGTWSGSVSWRIPD